MRLKPLHFSALLVGLVMGLLFSVQFKLTRDIAQTQPVQRAKTMAGQLEQARSERDEWQKKVAGLRDELDHTLAPRALGDLQAELEKARILAGNTPVVGPGLEVRLSDSNLAVKPGENPNLYVLHDEDVLKVINELKAAGAEALAINEQRLTATSEIRCIGPTILTNKSQRLSPPFVIYAIGNPETMLSALNMRGGVVESLRFWGIQVSMHKLDRITIPALAGGF
ncbi:MAG: DUF881 domain-containing protein [Bacillota bacterium]|uniref:DUF881 domain-containing protein n=1 Tax=Desulfurispora thermophila TaxID=265470 RepID=UPI00035CF760|nr:DUF881 domain-containing protein [Desulfurispora thermophila]